MKAASWIVLFECVRLALGEVCPQPCFCYPNFDIVGTITVDCRSLDLYEIPYPVPNTTAHLDLSGNLIQYVREADFPRGLTTLRFLQLQNNDLLNIEPRAFNRVPNLQTISLYNNRLRNLRDGVFDGLTNLQVIEGYSMGLEEFETGVFSELKNIVEIDLSFNKVNTLSALSFVNLPRLQRLSLGDNALVDIEALAVANLSSLTYLNLGYNQLMCITPRAFSRLPNLRTLVLSGNSIECGCCSVWLYEFLNRKTLSGPDCESPPNLAGFPLLSLGMDEFCVLPIATIEGMQEVYTVTGMSLTLSCTGSGAPPPDLSWSVDGRSLDEADERVSMVGGSLTISPANVNDSGTYYCSAMSTAGTVASSVEVRVLPFSSVPDENDIIGTRGDNMLLDCAPGLEGASQVTWVYMMMSLTDSDKYSITSNGSLLVRGVDLSDMGLYTCLLGDIIVNVTLTVVSTPEITDFSDGPCDDPGRLNVLSNENNILFCSSFAIPPPNVTLIFKGMIVNTSVPLSFMEGGTVRSEYVFAALPPPDIKVGGNFTCVASNEIGTVVKSVEVIVQRRVQNQTILSAGSQTAFVGETALLECNISLVVSPAMRFIFFWSRLDGAPLPLDRILFSQNMQTLVLTNLTTDESTRYICTVVSADGGDLFQLIYLLSVFQRAMALPECATPTVTALVGETATLRCPATGNPDPRRTWTIDGVDVSSPESPVSGRVTLRDDSELLIISSVMAEDSGVYNCFLFNIIAGLPSPNFNDSSDVILEVQRVPYFTYQPASLTETTSGDTVQLWCGGRGIPNPSVTWWRRLSDGNVTEVMSDGRVLIAEETLVFLSVMPSDDGVYYCNISSPLATRTSTDGMLRVFIPPMLAPLLVEYVYLEGAVNATLDCYGSGDPLPAIHWLRNGQVLPFPREQELFVNGTLVFFKLKREDAGTYRCRLANAGGMVYHNVTLTVRTFPDTLVEPSMLTAAVGSQVTLICSDGGRTPEEFKWIFNGDELLSAGDVHIRASGQLILTNVQVEDSGNYTCRIWGPPGPTDASAILVVEDRLFASGAPSSPPSIVTSTPPTLTVALGDTLQFVCLASGFPQPVVTWFKDDREQPNYSRVTIIPGGALTIENVRVTDAALYMCVASNALGTDSKTFNVTISRVPRFSIRPQAQTLMLRDTLVLECEATGTPQPLVMWLLNDVPLVSNGRRVIDPVSNKLTVFNTSIAEDSGIYSCFARSSAGSTEYAVSVTIQDIMIAPNITSRHDSTIIDVGQGLFLPCSASGYPIPTTTWSFNGTILPNCTTEIITMGIVCSERSSGSAGVIILTAKAGDAGRYTCTAVNAAGIAVYEVLVNVQIATSLPVFTVYPAPQNVVNGSLIVLDCLARGEPPPAISWLKDFLPLNISSDLRFQLEENGTLFIMESEIEDSGFYTCVANNGLGVNQVSVTVQVIALDLDVENTTAQGASPPILLTPPIGELFVLPLSTVMLDCVAMGTPTPIVRWFKDSESISVSQSPSIKLLNNGSLQLSNFSKSEEGSYSCLAMNSEGSAEAHVKLAVTGGFARGDGVPTGPVISLGPQDQDVLEGSEVKLDCQSDDDPTIVWSRGNGEPVYRDTTVSMEKNGSLLFSSVDSRDEGVYTCWALSSSGATQKQANLRVTAKREPPFFKVRPVSEVVVVSGDYFLLECEAYSSSSLTATSEWRREQGERIVADERVILFPGGALLIDNARVNDSGSYSCVASNDHGTSTATNHVTVLRFPVNSTLTAMEGSFSVLSCALPGTGVTWTKNGNPVSSYEGQVWLFEVSTSDEGEYSCSNGSQLVNYLLVVRAPPTITSSSTVVYVKEGGTAQLHCVTRGRPHPLIHWYYGGNEIAVPSFNYSPLNNGTLIVYEASTQLEGAYSCEARNVVGKKRVAMLLVVRNNT